jgi:hypothetical protein
MKESPPAIGTKQFQYLIEQSVGLHLVRIETIQGCQPDEMMAISRSMRISSSHSALFETIGRSFGEFWHVSETIFYPKILELPTILDEWKLEEPSLELGSNEASYLHIYQGEMLAWYEPDGLVQIYAEQGKIVDTGLSPGQYLVYYLAKNVGFITRIGVKRFLNTYGIPSLPGSPY